ncbi:MAG: type IV pili twitching motility protein PilT, partial [Planctomycetota bacterium]
MLLDQILETAFDHGASDIHIISGHRPMARLHTVMTPMDFPEITPDDAMAMFKHMAGEAHLKIFEKVKDVDFSYGVPKLGRFRVNAHLQRNSVGIALRAIKTKIPPLADLNLPEVISRLTYLPRG